MNNYVLSSNNSIEQLQRILMQIFLLFSFYIQLIQHIVQKPTTTKIKIISNFAHSSKYKKKIYTNMLKILGVGHKTLEKFRYEGRRRHFAGR